MESAVRAVARELARADCAVALTGAGVSTASGIPDFRGPQGLWRRVDPAKFEISYFEEHPDEVWELFVRHFGGFEARPNAAHFALAELEAMGKLCAVITQNVDGLHQAAGSRRVIELHGSLRHARCMACGALYDLREVVASFSGRAPRCPRCGGLLKPDVVFFGEPLPREAIWEAVMLAEMAQVFMAVGTSLYVSPANQLPLVAKRRGSRLVIINDDETALDSYADYVIRGRVEEVLPMLVGELSSMVL